MDTLEDLTKEELVDKVKELLQSIEDFDDRLVKTNDIMVKLKNKLLEGMQREKELLAGKRDAEERLQRSESDVAEMSSRNKALSAELEKLRSSTSLNPAIESNDTLKFIFDKLMQDKERVDRELTSLKLELTEKTLILASAEESKKNLEKRLGEVEAKLSAQGDATDLRRQLESARKENQTLTNSVEQLQSKIKTLQRESEEARIRLQEKESMPRQSRPIEQDISPSVFKSKTSSSSKAPVKKGISTVTGAKATEQKPTAPPKKEKPAPPIASKSALEAQKDSLFMELSLFSLDFPGGDVANAQEEVELAEREKSDDFGDISNLFDPMKLVEGVEAADSNEHIQIMQNNDAVAEKVNKEESSSEKTRTKGKRKAAELEPNRDQPQIAPKKSRKLSEVASPSLKKSEKFDDAIAETLESDKRPKELPEMPLPSSVRVDLPEEGFLKPPKPKSRNPSERSMTKNINDAVALLRELIINVPSTELAEYIVHGLHSVPPVAVASALIELSSELVEKPYQRSLMTKWIAIILFNCARRSQEFVISDFLQSVLDKGFGSIVTGEALESPRSNAKMPFHARVLLVKVIGILGNCIGSSREAALLLTSLAAMKSMGWLELCVSLLEEQPFIFDGLASSFLARSIFAIVEKYATEIPPSEAIHQRFLAFKHSQSHNFLRLSSSIDSLQKEMIQALKSTTATEAQLKEAKRALDLLSTHDLLA